MAKRRKRKQRKSPLAVRFGVSQRRYETIVKELTNARRRIARFNSVYGDVVTSTLDPSAYTVNAILERVEAGEKVNTIIKEVKNIGHEALIQAKPEPIVTETGYTLTPAETANILKAMQTANQNIEQARRKFSDLTDLMPEKFTVEQMKQSITGVESVESHLRRLSFFTKDKLVPTGLFETGEAGTQAEFEFYAEVIREENARREEKRKAVQNIVSQVSDEDTGFFNTQYLTDIKDIEISKLADMEAIKRVAGRWSDRARLERANTYVERYEKELDKLEGILDTQGFFEYEPDFEIKFAEMRDILSKMYNNEPIVTFASNFIPEINISIISPKGKEPGWYGTVDLDAIYKAFTMVKARLTP